MKSVNCAHDTSADDARRPACALGIHAGMPGAGWCLAHCKMRAAPGTTEPGKRERGWGDRVAAVTTALGIKPCPGCKERQAKLNQLGRKLTGG